MQTSHSGMGSGMEPPNHGYHPGPIHDHPHNNNHNNNINNTYHNPQQLRPVSQQPSQQPPTQPQPPQPQPPQPPQPQPPQPPQQPQYYPSQNYYPPTGGAGGSSDPQAAAQHQQHNHHNHNPKQPQPPQQQHQHPQQPQQQQHPGQPQHNQPHPPQQQQLGQPLPSQPSQQQQPQQQQQSQHLPLAQQPLMDPQQYLLQQQQQQMLQQQAIAQQQTQLSNNARQNYHHLPAIRQTASTPINILSAIAQNKIIIREVWAHNLHQEMKTLVSILDKYNYVAMDTEFPGVVARPTTYKNNNEFQYLSIKHNVDVLKLIQLGLCLFDENGNCLPDYCCWQFNFHFDLSKDQHAQDSISLLQQCGIDFNRLLEYGIPWQTFGETFLASGLVLNKKIHWIAFHSGSDFAYLVRLFTNQPLPASYQAFSSLIKIYCPKIYDIKYIMRCCDNLGPVGLEKTAQALKLHRNGQMHQAGSDSMLTAAVFFKIRNVYFDGELDDEKYCGVIYPLPSLTNQYSTPVWQ